MNTPLIVVTITRANMAKALAMFEERPDLVDHTMTDHTTGLDRVQAETMARRMVMSSCLAVELGLTPQQDINLLYTPPWQAVIDTLLRLYDNTKAQEAS